MFKNFKELKFRQKSDELRLELSKIIAEFPKEKNASEIERMLKAIIKTLDNKPLNP